MILLSFLAAAVIGMPTAAAYAHHSSGECGPFNEYGCESEYVDNDHSIWTDDYERGGIRTNYFSPIFERERRDYGYERDRYDRDYRKSHYSGYGGGLRVDFGYEPENRPLEWSEGFVAGEGFGDEYIGDPDQLNEEIPAWPY
jgi:hypothetical protein